MKEYSFQMRFSHDDDIIARSLVAMTLAHIDQVVKECYLESFKVDGVETTGSPKTKKKRKKGVKK